MNQPRREGPVHDGGQHTLKAVVLIVVLVAVGIAVLARSNPGHSAAGSSSTTRRTTAPAVTTTLPAPSTTTSVVPASQVKVQVLNGLLTGSLAGEWSTKLKTTYGYITEPADNTTAKTTTSAIYVLTPGYGPEAAALAARVGLPASAVNPTIPPPSTAPIPASERSSANLVLVVGTELAATA